MLTRVTLAACLGVAMLMSGPHAGLAQGNPLTLGSTPPLAQPDPTSNAAPQAVMQPQAMTAAAQAALSGRMPPMRGPVDPEAAAKAMQIPDSVPPNQLWQVGTAYYTHKRLPEAAGFFWKGAQAGDPRAMGALGLMYVKSAGVTGDPQKGRAWLTKAAQMGDRGAQYALGVCFERGIGGPASPETAVKLYAASAQQGFAPAAKALALDNEFGRGTPRNRAQAVRWMRQAAVEGDKEAQVLAAVLSNPRTPRFQSVQQLASYTRQVMRNGGQMASGSSAPPPQRPPAQAQPQASPQDMGEANAVAAMMRSSMGFGGIFGGMMGPPGGGGGGGCGGYTDPAACNAHQAGEDWSADRLQNQQSTPEERAWYGQ